MAGQPSQHFGMFVSGIEKRMNSTWRWRRVQRPITVPSSTRRSGEQGGGAVPLIIVGHRLAAPGLDRQSGLGAVARLDLTLRVEVEHYAGAGGST